MATSEPRRRGHRHPGGFTLLELLVVVAIIGLLAAFVGPRLFGHIGKSQVTAARAQIEALSRAVDTYRIDMGRFPDANEGLQALVKAPADSSHWNGPYLRKDVPLDPWGRPYAYHVPGPNGREYAIESLGRDGQPGGTGEDADITD